MKKLFLLFIGVLSMPTITAQNLNDAVRYSDGEIQGSARFRALSGAFGALGGDLSAITINPAGSAVFLKSYAAITLGNTNTKNETSYFNGRNSSSNSNFNIQQAGGVFVFQNNSGSPWKTISLAVAYENTKNYEDDWMSNGINTRSIDSYFLNNAQGLRLDEISALPGESTSDAYSEIGSAYGYQNQQAFLGYDSFILEPNTNDDDNTGYTSNIAGGTFNQEYSYAATGYNGKVAFNLGTQYGENVYLGLNLNSHFLNYERSTFLYEQNNNAGSIVNQVGFENNMSVTGSGFSFQLGSIFKLTEEFRVGLSYNSPKWMSIEEQTTQYLETVRDEAGSNVLKVIDPRILNVFEEYKLQTPGKITGSLAYVFGTKGLISFDYSRKDYANTKFKPTSDSYFRAQNAIIENQLTAASTYRVGGEYKLNRFSLRGGYRFEDSPYANGETVGDLNGYSIGLGYNFGNLNLDLTFDQSQQDNNYQLYNSGLVDSAAIDAVQSNVTLTLGFQL
ncbi:transporter [Bizionia saleffrena]|uniref:Transporter n=1 Tax=Bizionia saleffrena TaxID=291189 RepID=A0A8H2LJQ8_9FLAO|nr:outer membrane protein transport protein [Bizionia saleffrena]TYB69056.1 transporter [Bizionia saleffrena]